MGNQKTEQKGTALETLPDSVYFIAGGKKKKEQEDTTKPDYEGIAASAIARNREGLRSRTHALANPNTGGRARKRGGKLGHGHV